jgi:hypothetical protein
VGWVWPGPLHPPPDDVASFNSDQYRLALSLDDDGNRRRCHPALSFCLVNFMGPGWKQWTSEQLANGSQPQAHQS